MQGAECRAVVSSIAGSGTSRWCSWDHARIPSHQAHRRERLSPQWRERRFGCRSSAAVDLRLSWLFERKHARVPPKIGQSLISVEAGRGIVIRLGGR